MNLFRRDYVKIVSMEPTPSPYSIKVKVNEQLADSEAENYTKDDDLTDAPEYVRKLFSIEGIQGLYRVVDFITIQRNPRIAWEDILPHVKAALGTEGEITDLFSKAVDEHDEAFGDIKVEIQMIRNIPKQVKLTQGDGEQRIALSE